MSESIDLSTQQSVNSPAPAASKSARGVEHAGVIDAMIHDPVTDVVTLIMVEPRPWDGSELRLFQLQEKVNAYLSFMLDGEMLEAYPALDGKPLCIQLDCATFPDAETVGFLKHVREQIAFQGIDLQVRTAEEPGESCGSGCACGA